MTGMTYFLVGLALGWLLAWALLRRRLAQVQADLRESRETTVRREAELAAERQRLEDRVADEQAQVNRVKALSAEVLEKSSEQIVELAKRELGTKHLEAKGELDKRRASVEEMVKPIKESLDRFDGKLNSLEKERKEDHGHLRQQIEAMASANVKLRDETSNLTSALKAPVTRGTWGEIQLRRVCEYAGMLEHCDFYRQVTREGEVGRLRPDVVVQLPGGGCIVVDAKTPLDPYVKSTQAQDDREKAERLAALKDAMNARVRELSSKRYWEQFDESPDLVVMYVPIEAMYSAALEQDPELLEKGFSDRVLIATPVSLLGILRAIYFGWKHEQLAEHAADIRKSGAELHSRLGTFAQHFDRVRKSLSKAVEHYNEAARSFDARLVPSARKLESLGVDVRKSLPETTQVETAVVGVKSPAAG